MPQLYKNCRLCPRNCGVDRLAGETGFCGETAALRLGFAGIHFGEEPPLVEPGGSGTVFVSGCNLGCSFCQNWQISQSDIILQGQRRNREVSERERCQAPFAQSPFAQSPFAQPSHVPAKRAFGKPVSPQEFVQISAMLKEKGAGNINIVTGSHAIPALAECFAAVKKAGIKLPVVWNSSGYENPDALSLLQDYVDIYLPDLKTLDAEIAAKYFNAPDYPAAATAAILKMIEITREKVIIRHLILPGHLESTRAVLRWFADNARGQAQLSLLTQYTPIPDRDRDMPDRFLSKEEYDTVINWLEEFNIEDGFCQELVTANQGFGSDWLPDFNRTNPFSSELSVSVWSPAAKLPDLSLPAEY